MCDFIKACPLRGTDRFSILLIFVLFSLRLFAQPTNEKYKDECKDMMIYNDQIYLSGITKSLGNGNRCGYIAKYNTDGAFLTEFFWGKVETDEFHKISFSDGAIFTTGISYWRAGNSNEIVTAKLDSDLELEWIKNFGGLHWQYGFALRRLSDESLVFGGMDRVCGLGSPIVVKLNPSGETIWQNNYGDCSSEYLVDIAEKESGDLKLLTSLGGFYNYGTLWSTTYIEKADIVIYDVTSEGDVIAVDTIAGTQHDIPVKIEKHPNDKFVLLSHSQSYSENKSFDICIHFLTHDNTIEAVKIFGGENYEYASDMALDSEGNIHIIGTSASFYDYPVIYYLKLDANGNLLEEKTVVPENHAYGASLALHNDTVFIAANVKSVDDYGKIILIKNFEICDTFFVNDRIPEITIYPNPTTGIAFVDDHSFFKNSDDAYISVLDINGRLLSKSKYNGGKVQMDFSEFVSGNLILIISDGKYNVSQKVILK